MSPKSRRRLRRVAIALAVLLLLANFLAFMHARALTHFGPPGPAVTKPWNMSWGEKVRGLFFGVTIPRPTNSFTPEKYGLAFDTVRFQTIDNFDLEAWHIPCESPRGLVILFHGYMNAKASVLREAKVFHDLGFETMLVDFRGSGGSQGNETTVGWREADDVAAAVDYANRNLHTQCVILYGQSMGSAAILRAIALRGVKPNAIIVECPYDRMLNTIANRFTYLGVPSFPAARMLLFWGSVQQHNWAFSLNPAEYAKSVTCPALYIRGGDDPWVTQSEAEAILNNLRGEKTLVTISHCGHEGAYLRDPKNWTTAVSNFIGRVVSYPSGEIRR
jgi:alpha-beta hydrolase superfamily lysophospholipase